MKKLLVLLALFMLASCSTYYLNYYKYNIEKCERISDADLGKLSYSTEDKEKETNVKISDDFFDIQVSQISSGLKVLLNNKSDKEVLIDWDNSYFIDEKGQKSVLVNSYTEFSNPPHKQEPAKVYDDTRLSQFVSLSEYFEYDEEKYLKFKPLLGQEVFKNKSNLELNSKNYLDKSISINLALIYKEKSINYHVDLKINDYEIFEK